MHQKWHNAYEETIHVPLIFSNPILFPEPEAVHTLTSHVDLLPTLLGLAGADQAELQATLGQDHTEVHPLVGRDLSPLVLGEEAPEGAGDRVFFMTGDEISEGSLQKGICVQVTGRSFDPIQQPNHIETAIAAFQTDNGAEIWKFSRYFDNKGSSTRNRGHEHH